MYILATTLTIPPNTSIATVKSLIAFQVPSAAPSSEARLTYAGRTLDSPDKLLSDYHVPPSSTLELTFPMAGGAVSVDNAASSNSDLMAPTSSNPTDELAPAKPSPKPTVKSSSGGMKKKGPRCGATGCSALAQRIVGECGFCGGHFCGKHRLLESHSCEGLDDARKESKDRNREKLEGERTVSGRVLV